jgi:VCBS repeat-containing protein
MSNEARGLTRTRRSVSRNRLLALEPRMLFDGAAPVVVDKATQTRSGKEDTAIAITQVSVTDADNTTNKVTLTATHGKLTINTPGSLSISGNNSSQVTLSGSLDQINTALNGMTFLGDQDYNGAASINLQAIDGTTTIARNIDINVSPVNDVPVLGTNQISVNEGGSLTFNGAVDNATGGGFMQAQLGLGDVDNSQSQVIIKIVDAPQHGTLTLNGALLTAGSTFSVSQLGQLTYTHDGSQVTNPAGVADTFHINVDDGAGGLLTNQAVTMLVKPVDQAPTVTGSLNIIEGQQQVPLVGGGAVEPGVILQDRGQIVVTDPDQTPGHDYTYQLNSLPTHGTLFYNGVAITDPNFVIADISKLTYSHDGSEASGYIKDSFGLTVTDDGGGTGVPKSTTSTIDLNILPNDDDPVLAHSVTQDVATNGSTFTVSTAMLQVTDVDTPDTRALVYTVTGTPDATLGYFTIGGARLVAGATFTQADVDAGRIQYTANTPSGTARVDTLSFTVKDSAIQYYPVQRDGGIYQSDGTTLQTLTFNVDVPAATGTGIAPPAPPAAVTGDLTSRASNTATVDESGSVVLDQTQLFVNEAGPNIGPNQLTYRLLTTPSTGTILLNGQALAQFGTFTQADIDAGRVTIQNGGSEVFNDTFRYTVSDGNNQSSEQIFQIVVTPQNDTPTASLGAKTPVVNEGGTLAIDTNYVTLSDSDAPGDAPPGTQYAVTNDVSFTIGGLPVHGFLTLNGTTVGIGDVVTAAQLQAGLLVYHHDGSETTADAFTLTPFDNQGVTSPTATNQSSTGSPLTVNLTITPQNDPPQFVGKTDATGANAVYEGASVTINGAPNGGAPYLEYSDTDNSTEQRQYRITSGPDHGHLELNGVTLGVGSVFTQADLDAGLVKYVNDGLDTTTRADSFDYVVSDGDFSANDTTSFAQGTTPTASTFNIDIKQVNDPPAVTAPGGPIPVDSAAASHNAIPGFTVDDSADINAGGTDFIQVTVRLLDQNGSALQAGDYAAAGAMLLLADASGVTVTHAGTNSYLVFQGTQANVNAALSGLEVLFNNDGSNTIYQVQVIADDRTRDGTGALTSGANGGDVNQSTTQGGAPTAIVETPLDPFATDIPVTLAGNVAASTVTLYVSETNEPPTLVTPTIATAAEDVAGHIGGFTVADPESTAFGLPITVTVNAVEGFGTIGIGGAGSQTSFTLGNGHTVTIAGDNTGTLILTGQADDIQSLLNDSQNGLTYLSAPNDNADHNGATGGDVTLRVTVNEGSAAIGGDTGGGSVPNPPVTSDILVTVDPTNDAPTVVAGSGTVVVAQPGTNYAISGVSVADPDVSDGLSTGESDYIQVTVRLLDSNGNALAASAAAYANVVFGSTNAGTSGATVDGAYTGNGQALVLRGTVAQVDSYLAGLQVQFNGSTSNSDTHYLVDVIVDDRASAAGGQPDGSGLANGGKDLSADGTSAVNVPATPVDPYAAIPGGLTQDVAHATRDIFVSGFNDPAHIDVTNFTVPETAGTVTFNGRITVSDSDSVQADGTPGNNLSATISVDKGTITSIGSDPTFGGLVTGVGTAQLTINGATIAQINTILANMVVTTPNDQGPGGSRDWNGNFNVTVAVNDGGNTGQRPATLTGDTNDPTSNPGDFAYADPSGTSAALITTRTFNVTVSPVNDAPTRTDANPVTLTPVSEDGANPAGDTVQNLFGPKFQDTLDQVNGGSSPNAFQGIAITADNATASQGQWQYSTDNGSTWHAITGVQDTFALMLKATDMLRFVPATDFAGTPGSLVARLADNSVFVLTSGARTDVSGIRSGGTTAFSDANNAVTLTTSVSAVNDAPVLTGAGHITTREDVDPTANTGSTVDTILGSLYNDTRDNQSGIAGGTNTSTSLQGIVILGNTADPATQGSWQYKDGSGNWVDVPLGAALGAAGTAIYLPHDTSLRFEPVANYNGNPPALSISAVDGSVAPPAGIATGLTITTLGGTTQYSLPSTLTATVTPVNDAPTFDSLDSGTPIVVKGQTAVDLDADGTVHVSDIELDASVTHWQGATLTVQRQGGVANVDDVFGWTAASGLVTQSNGTLTLGGVAIGTVSNTGGRLQVTFNASADASVVQTVMGAVTYRNNGDPAVQTANVNIDFTLNDQDSNNAGGGIAGGGQDQGEEGAKSVTHTVSVQVDTAPVVVAIGNKTGLDSSPITPIDVTTGFTDPDGDAMTYTASGLPPGLTFDPTTGVISGTPGHSDSQGGTNGAYTVSVTATDSHGGVTTQTFTITIGNPPPDAAPDANATDAATTVGGNVMNGDTGGVGKDIDPDGDPIHVSQVGGSGANVGTPIAGDHGGVFTISADGTYTFNPNGDFKDLAQGVTRTTQVTYQISDGEGGTATTTLTVTVTGLNDAPVTQATLPDKTGTDGAAITAIATSQAFTDPDTGDTLTYTASGLPAGLTIDAATGQITGTPDHSASQGGNSGTPGQYTITVTATDSHGETANQTFTLTIDNPPPVANNDTGITDQDASTSGNIINSANPGQSDTDPDGDALSVSQVNGSPANVGTVVAGSAGGQFTVNADGTYSFDPHGDFKDLGMGASRTTQVSYQVSDGQGGTSTATLTVTVTGVNDAPVTQGTLPDQTGSDSATITAIDTSQAFTDPDTGDTLTYTASGLPAGLTIDPATGQITGTPDHSASQGGAGVTPGVYTVTVTATDSHGATVDQTFTYTIGNPAPTALADTGATDQDTPTSGNVIHSLNPGQSDTDPDGDNLSVSQVNGNPAGVGTVVAGSAGGQFIVNADGTYTFDPHGDFADLGAGASRTTNVSYQVSDGEGGTSTTTLTVTVIGTNDAPTQQGSLPDKTGSDSAPITPIDTSAGFHDVDTGDTLTYTATGLPTGLTIDPATGQITGTPDHSASQGGNGGTPGEYTVTVTATDSHGASVDQAFTLTIGNPPPLANDDTGITDQLTSTSGNVITGATAAQADHDPDGDTISVSQVGGSAGNVGGVVAGDHGGRFVINPDGSYSFDPNGDFTDVAHGQSRTTSVQYTISDGEGGTSTATLTITVTGINDTPVPTGSLPNRANDDGQTSVDVDVTHAFTDPDGDPLTYTATGLPTGLVIDPHTGHITGTVDHSASHEINGGTYQVTVTATDTSGATVSRTFTWQVTNLPPTADNDSGSTPNDVPLKGNVLGNDRDPDGDHIDVTDFAVAGVPGTFQAGQTATIANVGTLTINADGSYTFTAVKGYTGDVPVTTYRVADGDGGTASAELRIGVTRAAGVPPRPPQSESGGVATAGSLTGNFGDEGGTLYWQYWATYPTVPHAEREPFPALFVGPAVEDSAEQSWWPEELGSIRSETIDAHLGMPQDLYVLNAVEASQRVQAAQDRILQQQSLSTIPGANPLFNDLDPLSRLAGAFGPQVLQGIEPHGRHDARPHARDAQHPGDNDHGRNRGQGSGAGRATSGGATQTPVPSFTQQINQAAATQAPPPARTSAVKPANRP